MDIDIERGDDFYVYFDVDKPLANEYPPQSD